MNRNIIEEDFNYIIGDSHFPWDELEGSTVFITGANGMLPSYMVETIMHLNRYKFNEPMKVIAAVRNTVKANARFREYLNDENLVIKKTNINESLSHIAEPIDYIIHAASIATPSLYSVIPADVIIPNTIGTFNCLELSRMNDIKGFLFFSSGEIYGEVPHSDSPITEEMIGGILDHTSERSCYAESKRAGEAMCLAWHRQYGTPIKIVRPFHTYGAYMPLGDGRVFSDFVNDVVNGLDVVVRGDPDTKRTFCYISDATIAYFLTLIKGTAGAAYNVGGDRNFEMNVKSLAMTVAFIGGVGVTIKDDHCSTPYNHRVPDISKMRELGWNPRISVEEGFRRTIESFKDSRRSR